MAGVSIGGLWQDLRYAARQLRRTPGFTLTALFALALGIGVNTAAFTGYKAMVLRPLDARDPTAMVDLSVVRQSGLVDTYFSYPDYEAYRDRLHFLRGSDCDRSSRQSDALGRRRQS